MDLFKTFMIVIGVSIMDLLIEFIYQFFVLYSFDSFISSFNGISKNILNDHLKHNLKHNITHTITHLAIHGMLIAFSIFMIFLLFSSSLKKNIFGFVSYGLIAFPSFFGVSNFEIFLLQTQCALIRYFESKWIWDLFVPLKYSYKLLWLAFAFFLWAPVEMRTKIFLETKLHHNAVIVIGLAHAFASVVYPYLKLFISLNFLNSQTIRLDSKIEQANLNLKNLTLVLLPGESHHTSITSIGFFNKNYFLIQGHRPDYADYIATFLFESYKFTAFYKICNLLAPFFVNMMFSLLLIYLSKRWLKDIHLHEVHHITLYLMIEEFFNLGYVKYLYAPYRILERMIISRSDLSVKKGLEMAQNKEILLRTLIENQAHSSTPVISSKFHEILDSETNILNRINDLK